VALKGYLLSLRSKLQGLGCELTDEKPIAYGVQIRVESAGQQGLLRLYENKKGEIRVDFSQIRDRDFAERLARWIGVPDHPATKDTPHIDGDLIGADESGKGDYFGPLVCAAVYVGSSQLGALQSLGVRDSKALSNSAVLRLSCEIVDCCRGLFSVFELMPAEYNQRYAQVGNLNRLLAWSHAQSIQEVLRKVHVEQVVVDQFAAAALLERELAGIDASIHLTQVPRAEAVPAVAAASILARARYVQRMDELSRQFELDLPKGAANGVLQAARLFVKRYGRDELHRVAKLHFKTTGQI